MQSDNMVVHLEIAAGEQEAPPTHPWGTRVEHYFAVSGLPFHRNLQSRVCEQMPALSFNLGYIYIASSSLDSQFKCNSNSEIAKRHQAPTEPGKSKHASPAPTRYGSLWISCLVVETVQWFTRKKIKHWFSIAISHGHFLMLPLQKIEAHFDARSLAVTEMVMESGQQLPHKAPPRILPMPTSKSPTPPIIAAKVQMARQQSPSPVRQSPSPVRHVRAPTPSPVR